MSSAAQAWAWQVIRAGRSPTATCSLVLIRLADRADSEGQCWPGHECTARDLSIGERTVRESIAELRNRGLLVVEARTAANGRQISNLYRLPIDGRGADLATQAKSARGVGDIRQEEVANPAGCKRGRISPPLNQTMNLKDEQQPAPEFVLPVVVVLSQDLIDRGLLSKEEQKQLTELLIDAGEDAQAIADELSGALRARGRVGERGVKNALRFAAALLAAHKQLGISGITLTYAAEEKSLREARQAALLGQPHTQLAVHVEEPSRRAVPPPDAARAMLRRLKKGRH